LIRKTVVSSVITPSNDILIPSKPKTPDQIRKGSFSSNNPFHFDVLAADPLEDTSLNALNVNKELEGIFAKSRPTSGDDHPNSSPNTCTTIFSPIVSNSPKPKPRAPKAPVPTPRQTNVETDEVSSPVTNTNDLLSELNLQTQNSAPLPYPVTSNYESELNNLPSFSVRAESQIDPVYSLQKDKPKPAPPPPKDDQWLNGLTDSDKKIAKHFQKDYEQQVILAALNLAVLNEHSISEPKSKNLLSNLLFQKSSQEFKKRASKILALIESISYLQTTCDSSLDKVIATLSLFEGNQDFSEISLKLSNMGFKNKYSIESVYDKCGKNKEETLNYLIQICLQNNMEE